MIVLWALLLLQDWILCHLNRLVDLSDCIIVRWLDFYPLASLNSSRTAVSWFEQFLRQAGRFDQFLQFFEFYVLMRLLFQWKKLLLEQVLINLDDFFVFLSFSLGKDKLVVVLEEVALERTQFDFKQPFKSYLISYEADDIKLLLQTCIPTLDSLFTWTFLPHAAADDLI